MLAVVLTASAWPGRAQKITIGSVKGFATVVLCSQFVTTARLALGQKVLFDSVTNLLPEECEQTCASEAVSSPRKRRKAKFSWDSAGGVGQPGPVSLLLLSRMDGGISACASRGGYGI